jgi:hypothetical protein
VKATTRAGESVAHPEAHHRSVMKWHGASDSLAADARGQADDAQLLIAPRKPNGTQASAARSKYERIESNPLSP